MRERERAGRLRDTSAYRSVGVAACKATPFALFIVQRAASGGGGCSSLRRGETVRVANIIFNFRRNCFAITVRVNKSEGDALRIQCRLHADGFTVSGGLRSPVVNGICGAIKEFYTKVSKEY